MPGSRPACAYLLLGEDETARSERVTELIAERLEEGSRDFNLDRLSAREGDPSVVATLLQTPPLLGGWRVVVLTDVDGGPSPLGDVIAGFLHDPSPTTCLVAVAGSRPVGEPWASFRKLGREETFDPPKGAAAVKARVREQVRRSGKEIEDRAAAMLAELHPDGSQALVPEVAKAVAHAGERERVTVADVEAVTVSSPGARARFTVADVEAVTVSSPGANRYVFVDLVGMGRAAEAAAELHALLEQGESPIYLVTLLAQHFLLLGGIRACEARGERDSAAIAAALGAKAWLLDRRNFRIPGHESVRVQARRYDRAAVDRWLAGLLELDLALKSSRLPEHARLEEGVLRLMRPAPGTPAA